jgi:phosphate transport system permease protein
VSVLDLTKPTPEVKPPSIDVRVSTLSRKRRIRNGVATALMVLAFLLAVVPLGFVIVNVTQKGLAVMSPSFLHRTIPPNTSSNDLSASSLSAYGGIAVKTVAPKVKLGIGPAIVGTLLTTGMASLLAIPLGILGAIYLNEFGKKKRLARFIRFMTDVMTGVPSVVMGVFIYSIWVVRFGVQGRSAFAASLALACLMLPIVVRTSEEMLRLVPDTQREASAALGVRTWRTTLSVVLPAAVPGITSGSMLAVARAAGETAPVLFTIGAVYKYNVSLHGGNTSLSAFIWNQAALTGDTALKLAWGAALTLITMVLVLTLLARLISSRLAVR